MRIKLLCAMALLLGSCAKENSEVTPESEAQVVTFEMTKATDSNENLDIPDTYRFSIWNTHKYYFHYYYINNIQYQATGTYVKDGDNYLKPCKVVEETGAEIDENDSEKWLTSNGLHTSDATLDLVATRPAIMPTAEYITYPVKDGKKEKILGYDIYRKDSKQFYLGIEKDVRINGMSINNQRVFSFDEPLKEQRATITLKIKSKEANAKYTDLSIDYCNVAKQVKYHPYHGHYVDHTWLANYDLVTDKSTVSDTEETIVDTTTTLADEDGITLTDKDGKFNILAMDYTSERTHAEIPYIKINFLNNGVASNIEIPLYRNFTPQLNYVATLEISSLYADLKIVPASWGDIPVDGSFNDDEFTTVTVKVTHDGNWGNGGNITGEINE